MRRFEREIDRKIRRSLKLDESFWSCEEETGWILSTTATKFKKGLFFLKGP